MREKLNTAGNGQTRPYLTVVATSRNDGHGGDLLTRMQAFVSALTSQVILHGVPSELVLVEWNPPADRPRVADALTWPDDQGWCPVRIITVPRTLHRQFAHSDRLPLFQMIAKNVGIRRARGQFVLATNVDILFSDPVMAFLGQRKLLCGHMYRSDRIDVERGVSVEDTNDAQLAYCRTHVLRAYRPDGIRFAPSDGSPHTLEDATLSEEDILLQKGSGRPHLPLGLWLRKRFKRTTFSRAVSRLPLWRILREKWRVLPEARRANRDTKRAYHSLLAHGRASDESHRPNLSFTNVIWPLLLLPDLHVLACGDFTLMAKETWFDIGGNPELEMFSLHLDSLAMYNAHARGAIEVRLPPHMVHYHIEHERGWTPESGRVLYERVQTLGVPFMSQGLLARLAHQLPSRTKLRLSGPEWGLANCILEETRISRGRVLETSCTMGARA